MSDSEPSTPSARHWRDIPQEIAPRAMSPVGRRRLTLRTLRNIGLGVLSALALFGGYRFWQTMQHDPQRITAAGGGHPVEHIVVETNGVLDLEWVEQVLAIGPNIGLMELDLWSLRGKLESHSQVKKADLRREFPDTLYVLLEEHSPVVRLKARLDGPNLTDFLVSREGVVFEGIGFSEGSVRALPWLGGVKLLRTEAGFVDLTGMDRVADLLATARGNVPELYYTWRVVSLERMAQDGQILVQTSEVPQIVFGLREDFYTQVARLDLILDRVRGRAEPIKSIDLSVGASQVPVAMSFVEKRSGAPEMPTVRFSVPSL